MRFEGARRTADDGDVVRGERTDKLPQLCRICRSPMDHPIEIGGHDDFGFECKGASHSVETCTADTATRRSLPFHEGSVVLKRIGHCRVGILGGLHDDRRE